MQTLLTHAHIIILMFSICRTAMATQALPLPASVRQALCDQLAIAPEECSVTSMNGGTSVTAIALVQTRQKKYVVRVKPETISPQALAAELYMRTYLKIHDITKSL